MQIFMKILTLSAMLFLSACGAAPTFNGTSTLGNTGVVASSISNSKSTNSVNTITVSSTNNVTASSAKSTTTSRANSSSAVTSSVSVVIASSSSKSSSAPKTTSHNVGKNCLSCHKIGGPGSAFAVFTAAGSIYQSNGAVQINAIIRLYAPGTNTISAQLETDASGNFYTANPIAGLASGTGVDAEVEGPGGQKINMGSLVKNGGCSSCHNGTTTSKIMID
jgi:hypothetical protein